MIRHSFSDDYSEGCHPRILKALEASNLQQQTAYGEDEFSREACGLIKQEVAQPDADVYLVSSGTQANVICIAAALRPYEAVITAASGHVVGREAGAIEATGHKLITLPSDDGKLTTGAIEQALAGNAHFPHMAKPRLVYISNATEFGTVYSKHELEQLSQLCKSNDLLLMVDGARLGAALTAPAGDVSLPELAELADVFWIGGTKAGALLGEAIVVTNPLVKDGFAFHIKQRGAMLAKGRVLGIQFSELFRDGLFFELATHGNAMAEALSTGFIDNGFSLAASTDSNQVFPTLPNTAIATLRESFSFYDWQKVDDMSTVVRLVTSWATPRSEVDALISTLSKG